MSFPLLCTVCSALLFFVSRRVHEFAYLQHLERKCSDNSIGTAASDHSLPYFYAPPGLLDTDTPLVSQSFEAAKRFCSAAMLAVDCLMARESQAVGTQRYKRAFVIGRPPGHHAGPDG
jgi:acetoin utilization deacetylase AcuC-like enzyme